MAGKGGAIPGAGRKPGVPNKATAEIKALAQVHASVAIKELARLAVGAESEAARVAAIKELLDRGYGKSSQPLSGDADNPVQIRNRIEFVVTDPAG